MKRCRFCDREVPFYGSDTCSECRIKDTRTVEERVRQNLGVIEYQKLFKAEIRKVRDLKGDAPF